MERLIKKYYEYFLKGNFTDKTRIDEHSEFNSFYQIIINAYDINKNKDLQHNLHILAKLYSPYSIYRANLYDNEEIIEIKRKRFDKEMASFDWFIPSQHLISNRNFIYSHPSTRNVWAKIYISIKPEHYINTIIKLQDFIELLGQKYSMYAIGQCKFRTETPANDAIVLRFACKEHYEEFLEFIDKNKEIIESFDTSNPFLPKDKHGLSIITDENSSYNYFVTRMIWNYMFECREKKDTPSIEKLITFIDNYNLENDPLMSNASDNIINTFKYVLISKLSNVNDEEIIENLFQSKQYKKNIKNK